MTSTTLDNLDDLDNLDNLGVLSEILPRAGGHLCRPYERRRCSPPRIERRTSVR
ncbi:MAG: hypothetical protein M3Y23_06660 [Actinomycetota bacterium]|nr:hypothetical protein [Actinomycetota bacterium]